MRRLLPAFLLLLTLVCAGSVWAETFRFTASPRCPYACPVLPDQGALIHSVRRAFAAAGAGIAIDFLPWQRAVATARHDPAFAGYLADDGSVARGFVLSPPLMSGTLGLAARRGGEQGDVSPAALHGLSLAVVAGRQITAVIDADVFAWQLRHAVDLAPARDLLIFNPVALGHKTRHVAFAGNPLGRRAQMTFAAGRALQGVWPMQVSQLPGEDAAERLR